MVNKEYIKDNMKLYNRDCMEGMAEYPDNYFDLAIVDIPYGINAGHQSNKSGYVTQKNGSKIFVNDEGFSKKDWDKEPPPPEYFIELMRVSKNQIIWGVNYVDYMSFSHGRLVWDKINDHSDQSDCEIAYCSLNDGDYKKYGRVDIVRYMWAGFMQGVGADKSIEKSNIQMGNKSKNEKKIHPTQKPIKLYQWLLSNYSSPEHKILDTHLGSASHAIAWHYFQKGGEFVGYELDEEYFDKSIARIEQETAQISMF